MAATKRMSPQAFAAVQKKYSPVHFSPQIVYKPKLGREIWASPRISLRRQADMRNNCIALGIDPSGIGLPEKKEKKPPRVIPPKGKKHERTAAERKARIAKALQEMDKTIETWRKEKKEEYQRAKPVLPF
ncbi:2429_t:CDS:2 [Paraglomus brasilianum]|uniref:2429_t:CDS:1 n=1 Tax=Paraglomus brasilianum TaxID=144538 RepID=A0A9N9AGU7_9GLOM|nr:2429_t:CDS:2 [Paraglomus brasilianum]